jgi:hypothetical protein
VSGEEGRRIDRPVKGRLVCNIKGGEDTSDATPDVAGLQEKFNIGAIDWVVVDATGMPGQTLKQCRPHIARGEAA